MRASCPVPHILLNLTILIMSKSTNDVAPQYSHIYTVTCKLFNFRRHFVVRCLQELFFTADIRPEADSSLARSLRNARIQRAAYKKHVMNGCVGMFGFVKPVK
jgi:hypothetical protein